MLNNASGMTFPALKKLPGQYNGEVSQPPRPDYLGTARRHLERVQAAWYEPTDWDDLTLYGFYCLEAAVMAAATALDWNIASTHQAKADAAHRLTVEHGLPDIHYRLLALNRARKAVAYGDTALPDLNAEQVARALEEYVEAVVRFTSARDEN